MITAPNETYIYLQCTDGAANHNKFYSMKNNGDGTFTALYGREGDPNPRKEIYSMSKWNEKYNNKVNKPGSKKSYTDVTKFKSELSTMSVNKSGELISKDKEVVNLIQILQEFANVATKASYKVEAKQVTQAQIDEAQRLVNNLSAATKYLGKSTWDINKFHRGQEALYTIIPRKMKQVAAHFIREEVGYWDEKARTYIVTGGRKSQTQIAEEIEKLIEAEQDLLDSMASQVTANTASAAPATISEDKTLLEALGLQIRPATKAEFEEAKSQARDHGYKIKRVFRVINNATQAAFDKSLKTATGTHKTVSTLWHGSRGQNWWFILQQGLRIRPSGAVHTGSLLGDAIYFANSDDKSWGYTDGGRWVNGTSKSHTYMALYDVRIGNQLHMRNETYQINHPKTQLFDKGYDSVYAHKGAHTGWANLRKDEFTIYENSQSTIKYLIEFA